MLTTLFLFTLVGMTAGILAGMFGLGGGLIVVPSIAFYFHYAHLAPENTMHFASGTSLAIMIVTSASSTYSHMKRRNILWDETKRFFPGLILGTITGAILAHYTPSDWLHKFFGFFMLIIVAKIFFYSLTPTDEVHYPKNPIASFLSFLLSTISGTLGLGSGSMMLPLLNLYRVNLRYAVGTAATCTFAVSIIGTGAVAITGMHTHILPWSTGYIYWPAFAPIAFGSIFFAPLGSWFTTRLPHKTLEHILGVILLIIALRMLW